MLTNSIMRHTAEDRKAQIIREAGRLFSRDGYESMTIRQLADVCGVTEPAIYRHFESKEAIYNSVLESLANRMDSQELFQELQTVNDVELLLHRLATHIIEFFVQHEDVHRLVLYSTLRGHGRSRQLFDTIRGNYVRYLTVQLNRLFENGFIIQRNNELTARCFIGMVFDCALSVTVWRGMLGHTYSPEDVVANNIPIYARGLKK